MAFGRFVNEFQILSGKINGSLDQVARILMACAQLQNFIVQQDHPFKQPYQSVEEEMEGINCLPDPLAPLELPYLLVVPDKAFKIYGLPKSTHTSEAIVEFLRDSEILRLVHNDEGMKRELAASGAVLTIHSPIRMQWG